MGDGERNESMLMYDIDGTTDDQQAIQTSLENLRENVVEIFGTSHVESADADPQLGGDLIELSQRGNADRIRRAPNRGDAGVAGAASLRSANRFPKTSGEAS